jgi:hypothetical protein
MNYAAIRSGIDPPRRQLAISVPMQDHVHRLRPAFERGGRLFLCARHAPHCVGATVSAKGCPQLVEAMPFLPTITLCP